MAGVIGLQPHVISISCFGGLFSLAFSLTMGVKQGLDVSCGVVEAGEVDILIFTCLTLSPDSFDANYQAGSDELG